MKRQEQDLFDEALRTWAARPVRTAADRAARQVLRRLPESRAARWGFGTSWRLATAGLGLALLLAVGWVTIPRVSEPMMPLNDLALPPVPEDVVVLWLDEVTPLYLTVAAPATEGGPR
jgi:hypothetical protein